MPNKKFEGVETASKELFGPQHAVKEQRRKRKRKALSPNRGASRPSSASPSKGAGHLSRSVDEDVLAVYVAPPGMEHVVKKLKNKKGVDNPYAVAWSMHEDKKERSVAASRGITVFGPVEDIFQENLATLDYIAKGRYCVNEMVIVRLHDDALEDLRRQYTKEKVANGINMFEVWKHVLGEAKGEALAAVVQKSSGFGSFKPRTVFYEEDRDTVGGYPIHRVLRKYENLPDAQNKKLEVRREIEKTDDKVGVQARQGATFLADEDVAEGQTRNEYDSERVAEEVAGKGKGITKRPDEPDLKDKFFTDLDILDRVIYEHEGEYPDPMTHIRPRSPNVAEVKKTKAKDKKDLPKKQGVIHNFGAIFEKHKPK